MAANAIEAADALCVITAADIEFKTIARMLSGGSSTVEDGLQILRSQHDTRAVTLLKSEIGAVGFAEKLRAHLMRHPYKALLVIGLAGALDPARGTTRQSVAAQGWRPPSTTRSWTAGPRRFASTSRSRG